ncbi:MAG: DegT/DnrJ/EryC1/StrS aminotransferase family protein, partial [Candidatus Omnitrophica bacterium]|nr:DegT/DnrJ/EryC1/StrS aminotransferase family protein [Candidatus Omnitrophota bacterium]
MRTIPHSRPSLGAEERKKVVATLRSGQIAQGRIVERTEKAFADFVGVKGAVLFNSGTAACHLALLALGIKKKDEVILPSYTCSALLNAIYYTGAKPILCDVHRSNFNLDPAEARKRIGKKTSAIIIPYIFGAP